MLSGRPRSCSSPPSVGRQLKFLRAHYEAAGRAETATNLAEAAGHKSFDGIDLRYGLLASRIGNAPGKPDANLSLLGEFTGPTWLTNEHWILFMRPEFAGALEKVGWV